MDWVSLLTLACGVFILLIGYRVFLLDSKKKTYRLFFLIAAICSLMCFCWYEMSQTAVLSKAIYYLKLKGVWVFLFPLIAYLLYDFSGINHKKTPTWLKSTFGLFIFLPAFYFFYIESFTSFRTEGIIRMQNGQWGLSLHQCDMVCMLRTTWVLLCSLISVYFFVYFYRMEKGIEKKRRKKYAMILFALCIMTSLIQNNVFPFLGLILPINESITTIIGVILLAWLVIDFQLSDLEAGKSMDKVINAMTNLMILTNEKYIIQKINPAALLFFGVNESEVIGNSLEVLMEHKVVESIKELNANMKGKNDKEFVFQRKDQLAYLLLSTSPIYNQKQKLIGYALVGADLTRLKSNERKLSRYKQKIRRFDEQLQHFAYITSHDLKEPLRNISNYTTKLERELKPLLKDNLQDYFGFITEGVKRMYSLIESIKDVSDINSSTHSSESVDTSQLISKIKEKLQNVIEDKGATIHTSALPRINGNPNHFELLFFNLIDNGLRYNQSDEPKVSIGCHREEGRFVFFVEDNGIGVEPEYSEYIFKMFKRLHSRAYYDGIGMGLAICRSVVEKNGGLIWIEANDFGGTTFKFTLPRLYNGTFPLKQRKLSAVMG